jgi:preprotein translocase subunit SecE
MNRETKRLLQRQGQIDAEGNPAVATRREPPRPVAAGAPRGAATRTRPAEFLREVRAELRRVAWPTRAETLNAALVVLIALVVLTTIIFGMDTAFSKFTLFLFKR